MHVQYIYITPRKIFFYLHPFLDLSSLSVSQFGMFSHHPAWTEGRKSRSQDLLLQIQPTGWWPSSNMIKYGTTQHHPSLVHKKPREMGPSTNDPWIDTSKNGYSNDSMTSEHGIQQWGWKMMNFFNWVIFRFQPLIFRVYLKSTHTYPYPINIT